MGVMEFAKWVRTKIGEKPYSMHKRFKERGRYKTVANYIAFEDDAKYMTLTDLVVLWRAFKNKGSAEEFLAAAERIEAEQAKAENR